MNLLFCVFEFLVFILFFILVLRILFFFRRVFSKFFVVFKWVKELCFFLISVFSCLKLNNIYLYLFFICKYSNNNDKF